MKTTTATTKPTAQQTALAIAAEVHRQNSHRADRPEVQATARASYMEISGGKEPQTANAMDEAKALAEEVMYNTQPEAAQ